MELRNCIGCGQVDDHPRHVVVVDGNHTHVNWHMDCHAAANPPCPSCAIQVQGAEGVTGDAFRAHLTNPATADEHATAVAALNGE